MFIPMWAVVVGGILAVIGAITVVCLCPSVLENIFD